MGVYLRTEHVPMPPGFRAVCWWKNDDLDSETLIAARDNPHLVRFDQVAYVSPIVAMRVDHYDGEDEDDEDDCYYSPVLAQEDSLEGRSEVGLVKILSPGEEPDFDATKRVASMMVLATRPKS